MPRQNKIISINVQNITKYIKCNWIYSILYPISYKYHSFSQKSLILHIIWRVIQVIIEKPGKIGRDILCQNKIDIILYIDI